jgi:SAM-dependent methyltransferase
MANPASRGWFVLTALVVLVARTASSQQEAAPFEPKVGQPGKDVVWVPTPPALVEKMLDLAKVTPEDYVIDLGSGDGRNVIAAARRGARALGVEFNPQMVDLAKRKAAEAGVSRRAQFVRGDMYKADISKASVMALFLLPSNLFELRAKLLALKPGSRIVSNTFYIQDWPADQTETIDECSEWCTAVLWIVPAHVAGTWRLSPRGAASAASTNGLRGELSLMQNAQMVSGTLDGAAIAGGRLRGEALAFTIGDAKYAGTVKGEVMEGTMTTANGQARWTARRSRR